MMNQLSAKAAAAVKSVTDVFHDDRRAGNVIGSRTHNGTLRKGVDKEGAIGIDNGALRIRPLVTSGWGRAGIAYGPYERQNGLALAVFMLNGHNTAQAENLPDTFFDRLHRWLMGSGTYRQRERIVQWLLSKRKARMIRQARWWWRSHRGAPEVPRIDENLALGWFSKEIPENPLEDCNAFIMHATGVENGELWATVGGHSLPAVRGVQNLQIYYVIILRDKGAAYYAASVPGANGMTPYPYLRPLGVDPFNESSPLYPGIHQSVLGQIGFRLDTRVYGVRVESLQDCVDWYGTAHAADRMEGNGLLRRSDAETGGTWRVCVGDFQRSAQGARPREEENMAILNPGSPSGLVHVICRTGATDNTAGLVWRYQDRDNFWRLRISDDGCVLSIQENGAPVEIASSDKWRLKPDAANSIQVLDDGATISLHLQGELLFGTRFCDTRLRDATGAGVYAPDSDVYFSSFESHPRSVPLPATLRMGEPWLSKGAAVVLKDDFRSAAGDLAGRKTSVGVKTWRKQIGAGTFALTGDGAVKIQATAQRPNPGRTAYMVEWDYPEFADLSVEIIPPGTGPGQKEHGLCGFIFWQDPDNYITVNIWVNQGYGGASISCFFQVDGYEDLYDAIWSNVGKRVYYGVPLTLRMVLDGRRYTVFVNDEPVLFRALKDVYPDYRLFSINQVGLMANWEWGNDTGSLFRNFIGRV